MVPLGVEEGPNPRRHLNKARILMLNLRLVNLNLFLVFLIKNIGSSTGIVNIGVASVVAGVMIHIENAA